MKEITRIHIAKIAYDIELDAKKDIEKYMSALERYASDPDIMGDIEIRITELLQEHGVAAGGVITVDDVAAVRAQLGEPSDFAAEGADEVVAQEKSAEEPRRVYRDTDNAVMGGVLAGFGRFFGVDPLWVRLIFVVLLFASFGTGLVVYFILWLIIPPAETAAEKLRMSGQPVTLASIKSLVSREESQVERSQAMQKTMGIIGGSLLVMLAIGGLLAIVGVVFGTWFGVDATISEIADWNLHESWWFVVMMGLFIVSGLLFSALCFVLASAAFSRKWSKRIGTSVVAIVAAGLVVFTSGVAVGMYGYFDDQARIAALRQTQRVNLPAQFSTVKTLRIDSEYNTGGLGLIEYIVSDRPHYELEALPGFKTEFVISDDARLATVMLVREQTEQTWRPWDVASTPVLRIYGPALTNIDVHNNGQHVRYYNEQQQSAIDVVVRGGSSFELEGTYEKVNLTNETGATTRLEGAIIAELSVDSRGGTVEAGVVRLLTVQQQDICAGGSSEYNNYVEVEGVSSGTFIYNGKEEPAKSISENCGKVVIGDDEYEYEYGREEW